MEDTPIPIDSNGNYSLPPGYLGVPGQTILAQQHNAPLEDIAAALSQVVYRSGVAPFSGNQSMAGFKITNAANGAADQDYVTMSQLNAVIASITAATAPTGARLGFFRTAAPTGWIKGNGGTIGSAASGATTRANADTLNLYTLFWEQFSNTILPIQDSTGASTTRGASAVADFNANKRLPVFDLRDEYDRGADDGRGVDATLTVGKIQADLVKNHTHPVNEVPHSHPQFGSGTPGGTTTAQYSGALTAAAQQSTSTGAVLTNITIQNNTDGGAETRPRTVATLHCIKL